MSNETYPEGFMETEQIVVPPRVQGLITLPRLCFSDTMNCINNALVPLGIPLNMMFGVFWNQCMTRGFEDAIAMGCEYILTIDYDMVFTSDDVLKLIEIMDQQPKIDALVSMQMSRERGSETIAQQAGCQDFTRPFTEATWGNFGLTLFRAEKFANLKKPWIYGKPDAEGTWREWRTDDDIAFWMNWRESGNTVYHTGQVVIGHIENMVNWPGKNLRPVFQSVFDYRHNGKPDNVFVCSMHEPEPDSAT